MKKQKNQSPAVVGEAFLELIITRFLEVNQALAERKQAKAQKKGAKILSRCLVNRYNEDHPLPFSGTRKKDSALEVSQLWLSGDLASGRGGPEFLYVYSPIRFVEELWVEAMKVTSAPIEVSSNGRTETGTLSAGAAQGVAETFTTAGTVYLLNNLRAKLDEAIEDLFVEARVIVEELCRSTLDSSLGELAGVENDPTKISQSRFASIVKRIVAEGDGRRRKRLREGLWEIARGRGRPKGSTGSRATRRFSKERFLIELDQKIRELSRAEADVSRKEVAIALGLPNEKALDRVRRQFGDHRRWRET